MSVIAHYSGPDERPNSVHQALKETAKNAIKALFEDNSVSAETTLDDLVELGEYVEELEEAARCFVFPSDATDNDI